MRQNPGPPILAGIIAQLAGGCDRCVPGQETGIGIRQVIMAIGQLILLGSAAAFIERHTGPRVMRPTTYWDLLSRFAQLYS